MSQQMTMNLRSCAHSAKHQCDVWNHDCSNCLRNPDFDTSDLACTSCAHFGHLMYDRVYCVDVPVYISSSPIKKPTKRLRWQFGYPSWWYVDRFGKRSTRCGNYEKAVKR